MNKIKIIFLMLLAIMMVITSCQDDTPELGPMLDKSQIDFEVVQDLVTDAGGNTVIMKNNTAGTISMWDYGTGRSTRAQDTVHFAFKGDYVIKFSAVTAGGIVEMDPVTVTVTEDNLMYVNDPLWTLLTGGVDEEKTWVLDYDADAAVKFFAGPIYFSGDDYGWDNQCTVDGGNCWTWFPEPQSWFPGAADYGTMTFNLKGGPFISVDQKAITNSGLLSGTYFLDKDAKTIDFTDAIPLNMGWDQVYSKAYIITLTENSMQLAFQHPTKAEYEIYNYISKEYNDNWVPPDTGPPPTDDGFMPTFASGELLTLLTGGAGAGRIWELDGAGNPVDWLASGIGWTTSSSSSYNWGWNDSWTTASGNSWIRFDQFFGNQTYTLSQNGVVTTSTFTINEATNEITLGGTNTLITDGGNGSWMNPGTNVITVIKGWSTEFQTKGIWFGTSYDAGKDEWFVFHYILP